MWDALQSILVSTAWAQTPFSTKDNLYGLTKVGQALKYNTDQTLLGATSSLIKVFLSLIGIIFLGMILFAGYNWMTAMGEKEKVTKARDTLVGAAIGLVITISAYAITTFLFASFQIK